MPGAVTERLLFAAKEVVTRSLYAFVFYSPKGIKTKAFFVAATGKRIRAVRYSPRPNKFYPPAEKLRAGRPCTAMLSILTKERNLSHEHTCNRFNRSRMPCSRLYLLYGRWLANKWGIDPAAKTPAAGPRGRAGLRSDKRLYRLLLTSFHPSQAQALSPVQFRPLHSAGSRFFCGYFLAASSSVLLLTSVLCMPASKMTANPSDC